MLSEGRSDTPTEQFQMSLGERLRAADLDHVPTVPPAVDPWGDSTEEYDPLLDDTSDIPAASAEEGGLAGLLSGGDAADEEDLSSAPEGRHRRVLVVASLALLAVLGGLATGYAVVEAMGGWDTVWVSRDRDPGDPGSGGGGQPGDDELGQVGASGSPSPSASPSTSAPPSTGPSATGPAPASPTRSPAPEPTKPPDSPKPTQSTPAPTPTQTPQPTKSKPHDD
ncbi:MAG: hypothetical protein ACRDT6_13160 [Micromonosporaceae bacterium]